MDNANKIINRIDEYLKFHQLYCTENNENLWENREKTIDSYLEIWKYYCTEEKLMKILNILDEKEGQDEVSKQVIKNINKISKMAMNSKSKKDILIFTSMKVLMVAALFADIEDISKFVSKSLSLKSLLD